MVELQFGFSCAVKLYCNGWLPVGNMIWSNSTQSVSCQNSLKSGYFQYSHLSDLTCQVRLQKYLCQYDTGLGTEAETSLLTTMTAKQGQGVLAAPARHHKHKCRTFSFFKNITHNYNKVFLTHTIAKTWPLTPDTSNTFVQRDLQ